MTVGSQVKGCFASIKSAKATIDSLVSKAQDNNSRDVYKQASKLLGEVQYDLQHQIIFLSQEEPQYKP